MHGQWEEEEEELQQPVTSTLPEETHTFSIMPSPNWTLKFLCCVEARLVMPFASTTTAGFGVVRGTVHLRHNLHRGLVSQPCPDSQGSWLAAQLPPAPGQDLRQSALSLAVRPRGNTEAPAVASKTASMTAPKSPVQQTSGQPRDHTVVP